MDAAAPWLMSVSTGALLCPACRAWRCLVCGPVKARRLGRAVDGAGYDRWVTLTRLPRDPLQYMARLAYLIRKDTPVQWVWSLERGPKTGMLHAHAIMRAGWVENRQHQLTKLSRKAGGGFAWISKRRSNAGDYASKLAWYSGKGALRNYGEWLSWNGTRPWHWSRGYTGGVPMREWVPIHAPAEDPGPWRLVLAWDLEDVPARRAHVGAAREDDARAFVAAQGDAEYAPADLECALANVAAAFPAAIPPPDVAEQRRRNLTRRGNAFAGWRQVEADRRARRFWLEATRQSRRV